MSNFKIGQRVQLHPATDRWMMGDRYGCIVKLLRANDTREMVFAVVVEMDKSKRTLAFNPRDILPLI